MLTNEDDKLLMQAAFAPQALGRPMVMPPDVPADRVAALRKALADTFSDPEFLAESERMGRGVNAPRTGAQLQDGIARAYRSPSHVIERLQKLNNRDHHGRKDITKRRSTESHHGKTETD